MPKMLVAVLLEGAIVLGDLLIKQTTRNYHWALLPLACVIYAATIPGWYWLLKRMDLALLAIWLGALYIGLQIIAGVWLFHEPFGARRWIALALVGGALFVGR